MCFVYSLLLYKTQIDRLRSKQNFEPSMEALKQYEGRDDVEKWEAVESTYLEMLETKGTSRDALIFSGE